VNFEAAIAHVLRYEGGLSDDTRDPGGLTRFGISQRAHPDLDIAALTLNEAKQIYLRDYWWPVRAHELPEALRLPVFDCAVNQGVGTAVKLLQRAVGVPADGVIGPATMKAVAEDPRRAWTRFMAKRARRYAENPQFGVYGDGWLNRLFDVARSSMGE
jgi:lysozyme family protein